RFHQRSHVLILRSVQGPLDCSCQRSLRVARARHIDLELAAIFIGDFPRFVGIAHDVRRDQYDELRLADGAALHLESVTDQRNISKTGCWMRGVLGWFLNRPPSARGSALLTWTVGLNGSLLMV